MKSNINTTTTNPYFLCLHDNKSLLKEIISWIEVTHEPKAWNEKSTWVIRKTKRKGRRATILKLAIAETTYGVCKHRNELIFKENIRWDNNVETIIENIVHRGGQNRKVRKHLANMML